MAKVKGPILSLSASGQIAKSQVYASWKGVSYARQHVVPANPQTVEQNKTRNAFASLQEQWKLSPAIATAPFIAGASGRPLTDRNLFTRANLPGLRGETDMNNFKGSPGVLGGLPTVAVSAAANAVAGEIEVTVTSPASPTGWTLLSVDAVAFIDRDPADLPVDIPIADENLTPTADGNTLITLTGADSSVLYQVSAWLRYTRPDGKVAYGVSRNDTVTPL